MVVFIRYGNKLCRVHSTRIIRAGEEYNDGQPVTDDSEAADKSIVLPANIN